MSAALGGAVWLGSLAVRGVVDPRVPSWAEAILQLGALVIVPLGLHRLATERSAERRLYSLIAYAQPAAALALVLAFGREPGPLAIALTLPWLAVTGAVSLLGLLRWWLREKRWRPGDLGVDAALGFLVVGGAWTVADRAALMPLGFTSTIVLLTAVHFHYAGFALPLATGWAAGRRPGRLATAAVWGVVVGVPAVAVGITATQLGAPQGLEALAAVWTAAAGALSALLHLSLVRDGEAGTAARLLWSVAASALLFAMPLAALYGLRSTHAIPLDIPFMRALHGTALAIGFGVGGTLAWTLDGRRPRAPAAHR